MGRLSPDEMWRWDGTRWIPVSDIRPPAAAAAGSRPWLAIAGGATSVVAALVQFVACIFPYAYYSDTSPSIFSGGFDGDAWFIAEPLVVILGALGASALVMIGVNRTASAVSSGALVALAIQSTMMWVGYAGVAHAQGRVGPGSIIGLVGGVLLIVGGSLALTGVVTQRQEPAPTADMKSSIS
jgi:hypothetical protein